MKKILSAFLLTLLQFSVASNLVAEDYQTHAATVREAVWNWDNPEFKSYNIPEKYAHESAVIIAHHQHIEVTPKSQFRLFSLLTNNIEKLYYINIDRKMIKLNDKKALDEYSEFSFREESKVTRYFRNKVKTIVGARIIKPDGKIQTIDVADDAVAVTEGKKDKESFKKLAIRGLEIGDILDYFYAYEMDLETLNPPDQTFYFYSKYPTLSYSVKCVIDKRLTAEYRSVNGAPEFQELIVADRDPVLQVSQCDLKMTADLEDSRWGSAERSLPMIHLVILNNSSRYIPTSANARKSGVYKDVSYEDILRDKESNLVGYSRARYFLSDMLKKVDSVIVHCRKEYPKVTSEGLATYIYEALRFYWPTNYPLMKFHYELEKKLKENNIECKMCFVTSRFGARKEDVVEADDLTLFVSANDNKQLFFFPIGYASAGEIPYQFEGEDVTAISVSRYKLDKKKDILGTFSYFKIPSSSPDQNRCFITTDVSFSEKDPLVLQINRTRDDAGDSKGDLLDLFALYEDWDNVMRKRLFINTGFWDELQKDKESRKHMEQYKTYFEEKRKMQKEQAQSEIKAFHSTNSGNLINYSYVFVDSTNMDSCTHYKIEYTIDGLVKKAGDNFILDVGKLIGTQWEPTEKDRNRDIDAYIPFPITIEHEVSVDIPEAYTVEGIENLNKSIDNQFGMFSSSASIEGNLLKIKTKKIYKQSFVSKEDWPTFLQMFDVTNEFCSQSVLLKRKNADI